jgi:hypothetical protein
VQGVRERFAAHRGNVLISMDDFKTCTIENVEKKEKTALRFRDHGHEENIKHSYEMFRDPPDALLIMCGKPPPCSLPRKRRLKTNGR